MTNSVCILLLALAYLGLFGWAFRVLPGERWQVLAAVPDDRGEDGTWRATNFTYYGFWTATGVAVGVTMLIATTASIGVPPAGVLAIAATLLLICTPAASLVAKLVEGKRHTLTIGGASFLGFLLAPVVIVLMARMTPGQWGFELPLIPTLAAVGVAYAFGEGTGRLACISFGCCYGKPLSAIPPWLASAFRRFHFVFDGPTRKAAYAGGLEAVPLLPIQGLTAVVSVAAGVAGLALFARGSFHAAFLLTVVVTQGWRIVSEVLRADHRGEGPASPYQYMAGGNILYAIAITLLATTRPDPRADLVLGIEALWDPAIILGLQLCWLLMFLYTGRSRVTASSLTMHVNEDRI